MNRRTALLLAVAALLLAGGFIALHRSTPLPPGTKADRIVVDKHDRRLTLYARGRVLKTYRVALGRQPAGKKQRQGDDRTPEGMYTIDHRNTQSKYCLALHVSYPNRDDVRQARLGGYSAGGDIMVHGVRNGFEWIGPLHRTIDWTHGCIAVSDAEIREIAAAVQDGTPIEIRP